MSIEFCGICGRPLKAKLGIDYIPEGYEVVYYDNGNIKLIKLKEEVVK